MTKPTPPQGYTVITFGCQMNEYDSEILAGLMENLGYYPTKQPEEADIVLINTCCVRETAENKVFSLLGRLRKLKEKKPELLIGVSGCMSQQEGMAQQIRRRFPHVDLILGTGDAYRLPEILDRALSEGKAQNAVGTPTGIVENLPIKREKAVRAWVPIMFGCDNFCTYCVVPYVRGRERSRRAEDILPEIKELGQKGFREVVLLGQNVNSYGKDLAPSMDFADLLQQINKDAGAVLRFRYMTSHPRDFSAKLIETIASADRVCEHFHLPVQAGSDRILQMMNRGYNRKDYLTLIANIKNRLPDATVTTDIMVGFPGEAEEDFQDTLDLVRQVAFDSAYTFVYNPRPGTPAEKMAGQVPSLVKKERIQELQALLDQIGLAKNREEIGRQREVLVEGESPRGLGWLVGRSRGDKIVTFPGERELIGRLVTVPIERAHLAQLEGGKVVG